MKYTGVIVKCSDSPDVYPNGPRGTKPLARHADKAYKTFRLDSGYMEVSNKHFTITVCSNGEIHVEPHSQIKEAIDAKEGN